jgi:hypothetical protein
MNDKKLDYLNDLREAVCAAIDATRWLSKQNVAKDNGFKETTANTVLDELSPLLEHIEIETIMFRFRARLEDLGILDLPQRYGKDIHKFQIANNTKTLGLIDSLCLVYCIHNEDKDPFIVFDSRTLDI